jgi:hypothetical protein
MFGNLKHRKIWLAYFLPLLNFALHALPVWGEYITSNDAPSQPTPTKAGDNITAGTRACEK